MTARNERIERARLNGQMRQMIDRAKAEKDRPFTNEERLKYEKMLARYDELDAIIAKADEPAISEFASFRGNAAALGATRDEVFNSVMNSVRNKPSGVLSTGNWRRQTDYGDGEDAEHAEAFSAYLRKGIDRLSDDHRTVLNKTWRPNAAGILSVQNAQGTTPGSAGGFTIPTGFSGMLEVAMKWFGGIEGTVDTFTTASGNPWPWPTLNDTANRGRIIGQNVQVTETDLVFSQVTFNAYIGSSDLILVPLSLMEDKLTSPALT